MAVLILKQVYGFRKASFKDLYLYIFKFVLYPSLMIVFRYFIVRMCYPLRGEVANHTKVLIFEP